MTSVAEKLQRKGSRNAAAKQVRLKLVYIDFWSIVKFSFLIWICLGVVLIVATVLVWLVLNSTEVFDTVDSLLRDILGNDSFTIASSFGLGQVTMFAFVVAALNTVTGTILGAIAALLYNLSVKLTGGILVGFQNS